MTLTVYQLVSPAFDSSFVDAGRQLAKMFKPYPRCRGAVAGLMFAVFAAVGGDPAHAGERPVVVELYTAQGCALCPPADAYLADLATRENVVALSFHVNLWDFIGWKDPFATLVTTRRQEVYAERLGVSAVFTPQTVVDGVLQGSGNDRAGIDNMIRSASGVRKPWVSVGLTQVAERRVQVTLPDSDYGGEAEVVLVRFDAQHETTVRRGENKGRKAVNVHVVRQLKPVTTWQGEPVELIVPIEDLGDGAGEDFAAVIVQEPGQGRILGVKVLALEID